jgi:molybdopterin/thiamine biosynthesis adenylyltransferase
VTYEEASARTVAIVDEHLLGGGADRRRIGEMLRRHRVRLVADQRVAASTAGQELILTTTLLVRRMGMAVEVFAPDAPLRADGSPFEGISLYEALRSVEHELLPATEFVIGFSGAGVDVEFVLGSSPATGKAERSLRVGVVGSRAMVAPVGQSLEIEPEARVVALAGAGIASAQAFRAFAARLPREFGIQISKDFSFSGRDEIDVGKILGLDPETLRASSLGRVDFVSAGAITNASLFTLLRLGAELRGRVIEGKELDAPDLNRYLLALARHVGFAKIEILAAASRAGIEITGVETLYDDATRAQLAPLAPRVMVGVDHVPSRWLVQLEDPETLVVGATEGFEAVVSFHRPNLPCAGCLHPTSPPNEATRTVSTISFVSFFSGFFQALLLALSAGGHEPGAQVIRVLPFAYSGTAVQLSPLGANPACPVGCAPSRSARAAA